MFILYQTSVKIAVLLHKQAKVPFVLDLAVHFLIIKVVARKNKTNIILCGKMVFFKRV